MARVLVVGGAGYVGSATASWLVDAGHRVWILDDLSTGHRELVASLRAVEGFTEARAGDRETVRSLLSTGRFDCVMHFAARSLVSESVAKADEYRENNVAQTRALLETMLAAGVRSFIFSSTCAIFGDPGSAAIREDLPKRPLNPYGETKLEAERVMEELAARGLRSIALRYFNAAGAEARQRVGEWHAPETHLIPRVLHAALTNQPVEIYGTDYPTPDGTPIRDYVHVSELAAAHGAAMARLLEAPADSSGRFEAFNLGSESGYSVRQIVDACERVTGRRIARVEKPRRPGDPPRLVADSARARAALGFAAGRDGGDLDRIIRSAWNWERKRSGAGSLAPAVFLDRDGTINQDPGYLADPAGMKLLPGVAEALASLHRAGFRLIVVSNQSGVARGLIPPDALPRIHARLDDLLRPAGAQIDHYELCFHHPDEDCACRKPKPKLILDAAEKMGVDLARSYMVGDKDSDLGAGRAAGCAASLLVRTGYGSKAEGALKAGDADFVGDSLGDVAKWILARG